MSIKRTEQLPKELVNALNMLGDVWILSILCNLSRSSLRFNELQRALGDVSPTTLVNRLKKLEKEKIIKRQEETVDKLSVVYSLTEKGRAILPITAEFRKFAEKYY